MELPVKYWTVSLAKCCGMSAILFKKKKTEKTEQEKKDTYSKVQIIDVQGLFVVDIVISMKMTPKHLFSSSGPNELISSARRSTERREDILGTVYLERSECATNKRIRSNDYIRICCGFWCPSFQHY